jgi:hypothetical protein
MLFGDLAQGKSPGQRILLVPKSWFMGSEDTQDHRMSTTRRLLRKAVRKFRVTLVPMGEVDQKTKGRYTAASVFGLTDFDRIVLLKAPALLINAAPMDAALAFAHPDASVTTLTMEGSDTERLDAPLLIRPSKVEYDRLSNMLEQFEESMDDKTLMKAAFSDLLTLDSLDYFNDTEPQHLTLMASTTDSLTQYQPSASSAESDATIVTNSFNATTFMREASFVRLWDAALPGPEYDVPYNVRAAARPKHDGARRVWEKVYDSFRGRRQDICGLDLEPWTEPGKSELK